MSRVCRPNVISHPVVHVTTPNAIVDTFIPLTTTTQLPTTTNRPYTVNAPRYSIHIPANRRCPLFSPSPIMQPKATGLERITDRYYSQTRTNLVSRFLRSAYISKHELYTCLFSVDNVGLFFPIENSIDAKR